MAEYFNDFAFFPWGFMCENIEEFVGGEDGVGADVIVTVLEDGGGYKGRVEGEDTGIGGGV